jgi:hypothetical protein
MKTKSKMTTIRLTFEERIYARALSKRLPGCKLVEVGSVAYALKYLLHEMAKKEKVPLGNVYTSSNV